MYFRVFFIIIKKFGTKNRIGNIWRTSQYQNGNFLIYIKSAEDSLRILL